MHDNTQKISKINLALILGTVFFAFMNFVGSSTTNGHFLDSINLILGRDFLNFYHYGIAAWSENPEVYYDTDFYKKQLTAFFGGHEYTFQQWSYPPHYLLLAAPFALVNYYIALAIFLGISIWLYWEFVIKEFDQPAFRSAMWFTPILLLFAICGQFSAIIAVIFVVVFRQMDKRPVFAGLLIALLTIKPQVGLLLPLFLMMTGRWKVFISASIGTVFFIGFSLLVHGYEPWLTYIEIGAPAQSKVLLNLPEITAGIMPTTFVNFYNAGLGFNLASLLHGIVAIIAICVMIYICRKTEDKFLQYAIFLSCTFLLTPYLMMYDMLIMVWVVLMMASKYKMSKLVTLNYICFMLLPIIGIIMALFHIPGSVLILIGMMAWIATEASKSKSTTRP